MSDFSIMPDAKVSRDGIISCKRCSSTRTYTRIIKEKDWIEVICKKCGALLYYDGA